MIYIHPCGQFTKTYDRLVNVQIEYSGPKDIMLVTNFPYAHKGVKSIVVPTDLFYTHRKRASKITAICYLLENKMIDDICWFHDFDAFQINDFPEDILKDKDAAFTEYGYGGLWNTGSFFFNINSLDIFQDIKKMMYRKRTGEEWALTKLTRRDIHNINSRIITLDNSYNMPRRYDLKIVESRAIFPIKVLHFHPQNKEEYRKALPLLPLELVNLFNKYGYTIDNE